jgi:hypothetical protein
MTEACVSDGTDDEIDYTSPTDLARFGRPNVVLTPRKITSVVKKRTPSQSWQGVLIVGCDGIEIEVKFDHEPAWNNCFEWVKQCILLNQI